MTILLALPQQPIWWVKPILIVQWMFQRLSLRFWEISYSKFKRFIQNILNRKIIFSFKWYHNLSKEKLGHTNICSRYFGPKNICVQKYSVKGILSWLANFLYGHVMRRQIDQKLCNFWTPILMVPAAQGTCSEGKRLVMLISISFCKFKILIRL